MKYSNICSEALHIRFHEKCLSLRFTTLVAIDSLLYNVLEMFSNFFIEI